MRVREDRLNFKAHIPNGVPALLTILAQTTTNQLVQFRIQICGQRIELRLGLDDRRQHVRNVLTLECLMSSEHFIQHTAECENIAALIGYTASCLFWRHVSSSTDDD